MKKILCVSVNPAIDNTVWINENLEGEPASVLREVSHAGGKSVNIAKTLTAFGQPVFLSGLMGEENKELFLNLLDEAGLCGFDFISTSGRTRENITVVFQNGKLLKINKRGSFCSADLMRLETALKAHFSEEFSFAVFSGCIPDGISKREYMRLIAAHSRFKVVIDSADFTPDELKEMRPHILKPNHHELAEITKMPTSSTAEIEAAAKTLLPFVEKLLISAREKGVVLVTRERILQAEVPKLKEVSSVGAGDACLAGYLWASEQGMAEDLCLKHAAAFGSAKVLVEGTGTITKEMVEEILQKIKISDCKYFH